jgi:hypothetical protein
MSPLNDFVVFCCHSVHIGESKPLHDDSFLRKIFSLLCSTISHPTTGYLDNRCYRELRSYLRHTG